MPAGNRLQASNLPLAGSLSRPYKGPSHGRPPLQGVWPWLAAPHCYVHCKNAARTLRIELRGVFGSLGIVGSVLSILLLDGPGGGPREESTWGCFWSSRLPATSASVAIYWLALCNILGTVVEVTGIEAAVAEVGAWGHVQDSGGWSPEDSTESAATQRRRGASGRSSRRRSDAAGGVESNNVGPSNWQRHGYDWEVATGSLLGGRAEHREKKRDAGKGELLSFESENEFVVPSQQSTERRWAVALIGALGRGDSNRGGSGCGERVAARWQER
ncbi:hypothetical protein B296_00032571 [Ensete ventricosum]|uniref:Uncharacterized protein n=1 Tax=Ensete ventricosum TaxID=4639 RepID=A0A426YTT1_ENSVE|nr:hypothetical protein B296_00032571 [Ensete ventricosum]